MKVLVGAFNQEKALVGAFSVIVQLHRLIDFAALVSSSPAGVWSCVWHQSLAIFTITRYLNLDRDNGRRVYLHGPCPVIRCYPATRECAVSRGSWSSLLHQNSERVLRYVKYEQRKYFLTSWVESGGMTTAKTWPRCPGAQCADSKTDAACNVAPSIHDRYMIDIDTW